jgi:periplasmic divalent cation tolerance protein
MTDKIVVMSTCETREEAGRIASALMEKRLAACVNILPGVESVYRWKGKVETAQEFLLIIKTSRARFAELEALIGKVHSYEVPEVIALPIVAGGEGYLAWMDRELKSEEE